MAKDDRSIGAKIYDPYPYNWRVSKNPTYLTGSNQGLSGFMKPYSQQETIGGVAGKGILHALDHIGEVGIDAWDMAMTPIQGWQKLFSLGNPAYKAPPNISKELTYPEFPNATIEEIMKLNKLGRNPDIDLRKEDSDVPLTQSELIQQKLQSMDELRKEEDEDLIDSPGLKTSTDSTSTSADGDGADTTSADTTGATDIDTRSPILPEQKLREGEDEQTGVEDAPKKDDQSDAFKEAMKSLEDAASGEVSKAKGLDYYKKQFADATGIDISGKPDTRAATIAFGLALMQNKAGKGFNVGRILSSVGEAGEKALPLAEAARKEARAAQISAGTYALQERKSAIASQIAQQQKKIDSVLEIEKEFRGYANQKELEKIKAVTKLRVEALKQEAESIQKAKDHKNDLSKDGFKVSGLTQKIPVGTQKEMKVSVGHKDIDGQMVFPFAEQEASQFATGLGQLEKATSTLDQIESNVQSIIDGGGSVTLEKATDIANNVLSALGANYSIYKDEDGKTAAGKITTNKILQDRLISQYKRFLTQETGNGISTKDLEIVKELIGQVSFFTNPAAALERIRQVRDIFDTPKQQILTQLEQFSDPKKHLTDDSYNNTMKIINEAALGASMLGGEMSFDLGEYDRDDDNNIIIDLTQLAG